MLSWCSDLNSLEILWDELKRHGISEDSGRNRNRMQRQVVKYSFPFLLYRKIKCSPDTKSRLYRPDLGAGFRFVIH